MLVTGLEGFSSAWNYTYRFLFSLSFRFCRLVVAGLIWKSSSANISSISAFKSFANCRFFDALLFILALFFAEDDCLVAEGYYSMIVCSSGGGLLIKRFISIVFDLNSSATWRLSSCIEASFTTSSFLHSSNSFLSASHSEVSSFCTF